MNTQTAAKSALPSRPKDRSPNYPRLTLENAISRTKMIYDQAGKASIDPDTAAKTMNYTNAANGKAQAAFSALAQYGLLSRDRKANKLCVSPLAIRIFHPVDDAQKLAAMREAALKPNVFADIHQQYGACSETVLASHLAQKDFTRDGAALAAATYKANSVIARLDTAEDIPLNQAAGAEQPEPTNQKNATLVSGVGQTDKFQRATIPPLTMQYADTPEKMLARYQIPLGANNAELVFTGERLEIEDFDALIDYVEIFKKQFQRRAKAQSSLPSFRSTVNDDFTAYHGAPPSKEEVGKE